MSHAYGHASEDESFGTIETALECGINPFDSADIYGNGHNELLLAQGRGVHARKVVNCD